jgi:hypothetical protein
MEEEIPIANAPLTSEEEAALQKLTQADFEFIDATILSYCLPRWRKTIVVASNTKNFLENRYPAFSYSFYGHRISWLAEKGLLISKGNLSYMRFSEVCLPSN